MAEQIFQEYKNMIIVEHKDLPSDDGSTQYSMLSDRGKVDFAIYNGELCAHTWECPKEGKWFLKQLEEHAQKLNLKLTIPTVLNPRLQSILERNGYTMKLVPYFDDVCELWSKS
jgi:hypothetical protein